MSKKPKQKKVAGKATRNRKAKTQEERDQEENKGRENKKRTWEQRKIEDLSVQRKLLVEGVIPECSAAGAGVESHHSLAIVGQVHILKAHIDFGCSL